MASGTGLVRSNSLKEGLEKVIALKGSTYKRIRCVLTFFENDDTGADLDAVSLRHCLEDVFGIEVFILRFEKQDALPSNTLRTYVLEKMAHILGGTPHLPSLFIFAYVGHGSVDQGTRKLRFESADRRQSINWDVVDSVAFSGLQGIAHQNIDALAILDCCYASAMRQRIGRTCQVLAACDRYETTRSRAAGLISFTQRFVRAARSILQTGAPGTTTDAVLEELQRQRPPGAPSAVLSILGGDGRPISLPFKKTGQLNQLTLSSDGNFSEVLAKISIAGSNQENFEELRDLLLSLPPQFKLDVVDAFKSTSIIVLLRMRWSVYTRLSSVVDVGFVSEIVGPSLMRAIPAPVAHE